MSSLSAATIKNIQGYAAIVLMCGILIGTHLLSLTVFMLFFYLFTDVITRFIHRRVPVLSMPVLFAFVYLLFAGLLILAVVKLTPFFMADFTRYYELIKVDTLRLGSMINLHTGANIDFSDLRAYVFDEGSGAMAHVIKILNGLSKGVIYFIFALVLNFLLFWEKSRIKSTFTTASDSLLTHLFGFVYLRVTRFYTYFRRVMGGQVIISLINTTISAVAIYSLNLPHKLSLIVIVFMCGLLPVVGNILSNTVLTVTALLSTGLFAAVICLILLVGIHKLEYFLNSKIIGTIIKLPMFVTLLALLIGEALLGIWGMILALPFVLTLKDELESFRTEC